MIYGAINEKGEVYYTDLKTVFDSIGNRQTEYNWLITDCVCYPDNPKTDAMLSKQYCWISGEELTSLVHAENFQWIWAVLCGFDKTVALSEILEYSLPVPFANITTGYSLSLVSSSEGYQTAYFPIVSSPASYS